MENEQTDKTNDTGKKTDTDSKDDKPLSIYEKTELIVNRQEAANKKTEELLTRQETLHANQRLAGTAGGHVDAKPKEETDRDYRTRIQKEMAQGKTEFGN